MTERAYSAEKATKARSDIHSASGGSIFNSNPSGLGRCSKKSFFFQKVAHGVGRLGTLIDPVLDSF